MRKVPSISGYVVFKVHSEHIFDSTQAPVSDLALLTNPSKYVGLVQQNRHQYHRLVEM